MANGKEGCLSFLLSQGLLGQCVVLLLFNLLRVRGLQIARQVNY